MAISSLSDIQFNFAVVGPELLHRNDARTASEWSLEPGRSR